jgi:hypothetical protein
VARERFEGIPAAERYVRVINGTPGLAALELVMNGHWFRLGPLSDGWDVTVDLGAAMVEGDANTLVVTGYGEPGAGALIMTTDSPADDFIELIEAAKLTFAPSASGLALSWPDRPGGWQLQESPTLGAGWADVKAAPVSAEGRMTVTVDVRGGTRFFRLRGVSALELGAKNVGAGLTRTTVVGPSTKQLQRAKLTYDDINW